MKILVTGAAGFIGFHASQRLLAAGHDVAGIDNLNAYYDVRLKEDRLALLQSQRGFTFDRIDIADRAAMEQFFARGRFDTVLHLAAQAGVRHSIDNPFAYADSNVTGMLTVLEGCRRSGVKHLVYASSSSVYGANSKLPFSVADRADEPVSFYAATKRANEAMAHAYAHLYGIPATGLRFFTVYGPWGRPDMAYFKFADAIRVGQPIDVYNHGDMKRDFTYIDDVGAALVAIVERGPKMPASGAPHRLYNVGHHSPESLMDMIAILESLMGRPAQQRMLPMQPGDMRSTFADIADIQRDYGFAPAVSLRDGLGHFVDWYVARYGHAAGH
jgi:UDP-glucuronate 4-epimerase